MKREKGFSLIEVLVATAILLVVVAATLSTLQDAIHASEAITLMADIQDNLRAGLNLMSRDVVQAGSGIPIAGIHIPHTDPLNNPGNQPIPLPINRPSPPGRAYTFPVQTTITAITPGFALGLNSLGQATDMLTVVYADNTLPWTQMAPINNTANPACNGVIAVNGSTNNFSVYFSDRRDNYIQAPLPSGWPPASPTGNETGEYGFNDTINSASQFGCPNGVSGAADADPGETFDAPQDTTVQTYGARAAYAPYPMAPGGAYAVNALFTAMTSAPFNALNNGVNSVLQPNWKCGTPPYIPTGPAVWPEWYVKNPQEARENPALFFRHALKLVNGGTLNLGVCPNTKNCGLAVASENPVYVQGDFNAPGGAFVAPYAPVGVIADAFTFLSNNWNDVNSFSSTYDTAGRAGATTGYRLAIAAGKGISFPQPVGYATPQDFGTDGGVHNFLRYIENWGPATLNYRGSIVSMYSDRQAIGPYKCCATVYSPPTRGYAFDTDFLDPTLLPPRTPMFRTEYVLPN